MEVPVAIYAQQVIQYLSERNRTTLPALLSGKPPPRSI